MTGPEHRDVSAVESHYARRGLLQEIRDGIARGGKTTNTITIDDLAPVDEFHIGGRTATLAVLDRLELTTTVHLLDIGCGLGGTARLAATRFGCRVSGIDITRDYVEAGQKLCEWIGLDHLVSLLQGSAVSMPFPDDAFDAACMLHVGMNIGDKPRLFAEIHRVLRPASRLAIYDVMRVADGDLNYPVPWSDTPETSTLDTPEEYKKAADGAGFVMIAERNLRDFAVSYFNEQKARSIAMDALPPLGLHTLMGHRRSAQILNMRTNLSLGIIAPVEIILQKR